MDIFTKTYCDGDVDVYRRRLQVLDEGKIELNCKINYFQAIRSKQALTIDRNNFERKEHPQSVKYFALHNAVRWN